MVRVTAPGGLVGVANWAERARNELDVIDAALNDEPGEDGDLRLPGGLVELLDDAGLEVVESGLVEVPWEVPDDDALVVGILLGEDLESGQGIREAAGPFRTSSGGYRFVNHFRYAVGRRPA